jgi:hypothetical protein
LPVVRSANGTNRSTIRCVPSSTKAPSVIGCPCSVNSSVPTTCIRRMVPVDVGMSNTGRCSDSLSMAGTL